jgi:YaiO family outer membrane protein
VDAYPHLSRRSYAYLNLGYSGASVFPAWRFGGEVYESLPHAIETSAGVRQLRFGGAPVTLWTGSVGAYCGNYWFSLRPFIRDKPTGSSASAGLTTRRYFADADNYVGASVSYGSTPGDELDVSEITRTSSRSAGIQGSHLVTRRTYGTWSLDFERDELSPGRFRNRWEGALGVRVTF